MSLAIPARELEGLEPLWTSGLGTAYEAYSDRSEYRVALAAALVETAVDLQELGAGIAGPGQLLLGDLCLARASRLLADAGDQRLQVEFARAVENVAAAAASGVPPPPIRQLLHSALREGQ